HDRSTGPPGHLDMIPVAPVPTVILADNARGLLADRAPPRPAGPGGPHGGWDTVGPGAFAESGWTRCPPPGGHSSWAMGGWPVTAAGAGPVRPGPWCVRGSGRRG